MALVPGKRRSAGRGSRKIREGMWRIAAGRPTIAQLLATLKTKLTRFGYRSVMVPDRAHECFDSWMQSSLQPAKAQPFEPSQHCRNTMRRQWPP